MEDLFEREVANDCLLFMLEYYGLIRRHIIVENDIRIHSHSFYLLEILSENKDRLFTMSECAKRVNITKQQFTRLVDMHERKGHVVRVDDEKNHRQVRLSITPLGEQYFERLKKLIIEELIRMVGHCDDDEKRDVRNCVNRLAEIIMKYRKQAEE